MRTLAHVMAYALERPWAIHPTWARTVLGILHRAQAQRLSDSEITELVEERREERDAQRMAADHLTASTGGQVAVVPVLGPVTGRGGQLRSSGMTSLEALRGVLRQLDNDPGVKSIVLDVDSPGGSVDGTPETWSAIRGIRKPVVAVANSWAASAAYHIASAADEIVVTPSGAVGSIGVMMLHQDVSKALDQEGVKHTYVHAGQFKVEGNPYEPLSAEAQAHWQSIVDDAYRTFTSHVAAGRGVSATVVRGERFGEGRMLVARDAVERGLADRIATLEETVQRLASGGRVSKRRKAEEPVAAPTASAEPARDEPPAPAVQLSDLELRERELAL